MNKIQSKGLSQAPKGMQVPAFKRETSNIVSGKTTGKKFTVKKAGKK